MYLNIIISFKKETDQNIVFVKDNGQGISPEQQEKLFKGMSNLTTTGTDNEQCSGLGLMLVSSFVNQIGGTIWVESYPEKGSTFSFTIQKINKSD